MPSLFDEMDALERKVRARIRELQPAATELTRLQTLADRMGIDIESGEGGRQTTRATTRRTTRRTTASPGTRGTNAAVQTAPTATRRPPTRRAKSQPRATATPNATANRSAASRQGSRRDDVLRLVKERPGITVRQIGAELAVDGTGLYRVVNKLTADGQIKKEGSSLQPA